MAAAAAAPAQLGGLTAAGLQAQYDLLRAHMPELPFRVAPRALARHLDDLCALAEAEPPSHADAAPAARVRKLLARGAARAAACQACGAAAAPGQQLKMLVDARLSFHERTLTAGAARWACGTCAALASPGLVLQLATPLPGGGEPEQDADRALQLQQLLLHVAAVNAAPPEVTGNPDALAVFVQELACRAYSLGVVASSLHGWRLLDARGREVRPGTPGAAARLCQELLRSAAGADSDAAPEAGAGGGGAPHKQGSQRLFKGEDPAVAAAARRQKRKSAPAEAAPAAGGAHVPAARGPGGTAKKAKREAATPGRGAAAAPGKGVAATPGKAKRKPAAGAGAFKTPQASLQSKSRKKTAQLQRSAPR